MSGTCGRVLDVTIGIHLLLLRLYGPEQNDDLRHLAHINFHSRRSPTGGDDLRATTSAFATLISAVTTLAHSHEKAMQIARPIPKPPQVMMAVLFFRRLWTLSRSSQHLPLIAIFHGSLNYVGK